MASGGRERGVRGGGFGFHRGPPLSLKRPPGYPTTQIEKKKTQKFVHGSFCRSSCRGEAGSHREIAPIGEVSEAILRWVTQSK